MTSPRLLAHAGQSPRERLSQTLFRGGMWVLAGKIFGMLASLGRYALLSRLLPPAELGAYFLMGSLVTLTTLVARIGLPNAVLRMVPQAIALKSPGRARTVLSRAAWVTFASSSCAALLLIPTGPLIAIKWFDSKVLASIVGLAPIWVVAATLNALFSESLRALKDIRAATLLGPLFVGSIGTALLVGWWVAFGSLTLADAVIQSIIATTLSVVVGVVVLRRKAIHLGPPSPVRVRELTQVSIPMWVTNLSLHALFQADIWILGAFRPEAEVAQYGAAARLIALVSVPLGLVNLVIPPYIAELDSAGQRMRLQRMLRGAATAAAIPSMTLLVALIAGAAWLLRLVYGDYYAQASIILAILASGKVFNVLSGSCGLVLMMTGHQRVIMRISLLVGATTVAALLLVVRPYGGPGVAIVSAISLIAQNLLMLFSARRSAGVWTHVTGDPIALRAIKERIMNLLHAPVRRGQN